MNEDNFETLDSVNNGEQNVQAQPVPQETNTPEEVNNAETTNTTVGSSNPLGEPLDAPLMTEEEKEKANNIADALSATALNNLISVPVGATGSEAVPAQPVAEQAPVQQPVAATEQVAQPAVSEQAVPQSISPAPEAPAPVQPVAPAPVAQPVQQEVQPAVQPAPVQPQVAQPVAQAPVAPAAPVAQTQQPVPAPTPVVAQPAAPVQTAAPQVPTVDPNAVQPNGQAPVNGGAPSGKPKLKFKLNNKTIIIIGVVLIALMIGFVVIKNLQKGGTAPAPTQQQTYTLEVTVEDEKYCTSKCSGSDKISITTNTEKAKMLDYVFDNSILYLDDAIYLYNVDSKESTKLDLGTDFDIYEINYDKNSKKATGIIYMGKETNSDIDAYRNTGYYDLKTNKVYYRNKYQHIYSLDNEYLRALSVEYETEEEYTTSYALLATSKEETVLSNDNDNIYAVKGTEGYFLVKGSKDTTSSGTSTIYSTNIQKLTKDNESNLNWSFGKDGMLYLVTTNNTVKVVDNSGNFKGSSKHFNPEYYKIHAVILNYVVYTEYTKLYISDGHDDYTEICDFDNELNKVTDVKYDSKEDKVIITIDDNMNYSYNLKDKTIS